MSTATEIALARLPDLREVEASLHLPGGSIRPCGLEITKTDATFEEWTSWCHVSGFFSAWSRWALGDLILFGERLFGEDEASQAVEGTASERYDVAHRITGLKVATLQNYVSLCHSVPIEVRRVELDFTVHEAVRALEREQQVYWLDQAVLNGWTRDELKEAIRDAQTADEAGEDGDGPARGEVVDDGPSIAERVERAARLCFNSAQPTAEGGALVPAAPWKQLAEALGEER